MEQSIDQLNCAVSIGSHWNQRSDTRRTVWATDWL